MHFFLENRTKVISENLVRLLDNKGGRNLYLGGTVIFYLTVRYQDSNTKNQCFSLHISHKYFWGKSDTHYNCVRSMHFNYFDQIANSERHMEKIIEKVSRTVLLLICILALSKRTILSINGL